MKKTQTSLKQSVYDELKQKIIRCELAPGARLTEEELTEMLAASRTPVRDAVSRLEQDRLLTIQPKKGILINTVSISNVNELFEARLRIEPFVVRTYGNRIKDRVYASCIAQMKTPAPDREEGYRQDDAFHQLFIDASENRYLSMFYDTIRDQVMRYRVLSDLENRGEETREEHLEIAMLCLRGSFDEAALAMKKHIDNSRIAIINYVLRENLDTGNIFTRNEE